MAPRKQEMEKKSTDVPALPPIRKFGVLLTPPPAVKTSICQTSASRAPILKSVLLSPPKRKSVLLTPPAPKSPYTRETMKPSSLIKPPTPASRTKTRASSPSPITKAKITSEAKVMVQRLTSTLKRRGTPVATDTTSRSDRKSRNAKPTDSASTYNKVMRKDKDSTCFPEDKRIVLRERAPDESREFPQNTENPRIIFTPKMKQTKLTDYPTEKERPCLGVPKFQRAFTRAKATKQEVLVDKIVTSTNKQNGVSDSKTRRDSTPRMTRRKRSIDLVNNDDNNSEDGRPMHVQEKQAEPAQLVRNLVKPNKNIGYRACPKSKRPTETANPLKGIQAVNAESDCEIVEVQSGRVVRGRRGRPPGKRANGELQQKTPETKCLTNNVYDPILQKAKRMKLTLDKIDDNVLFNIKINNPEFVKPQSENQLGQFHGTEILPAQKVFKTMKFTRTIQQLKMNVVLQGSTGCIQIPLREGSLRFGSDPDTLQIPFSAFNFPETETNTIQFETGSFSSENISLALPRECVAAITSGTGISKGAIAAVSSNIAAISPVISSKKTKVAAISSTIESDPASVPATTSAAIALEPTTEMFGQFLSSILSGLKNSVTTDSHSVQFGDANQTAGTNSKGAMKPDLLNGNSFRLETLSGGFNPAFFYGQGKSHSTITLNKSIKMNVSMKNANIQDLLPLINQDRTQTLRNFMTGFEFKVPSPPLAFPGPSKKVTKIRKKAENRQVCLPERKTNLRSCVQS